MSKAWHDMIGTIFGGIIGVITYSPLIRGLQAAHPYDCLREG